MNRITMEWAQGPDFPFLDIFIDGSSVTTLLDPDDFGVLPPFGWPGPGGRVLEAEGASRFLLLSPADLPDNRRSILVCGIDADLECGAATAMIEATPEVFVWSVFGWATTLYLEDGEHMQINTARYVSLGPFTFERRDYEDLFRPFLLHPPPCAT